MLVAQTLATLLAPQGLHHHQNQRLLAAALVALGQLVLQCQRLRQHQQLVHQQGQLVAAEPDAVLLKPVRRLFGLVPAVAVHQDGLELHQLDVAGFLQGLAV